MRKRLSRLVLLVVGVLTVAVILLSSSIYSPEGKNAAKEKARQETEKTPITAISQAPSDVVTSPPVRLEELSPTVVKMSAPQEKRSSPFFPIIRTLSPYLTTLFRAIISPNAP